MIPVLDGIKKAMLDDPSLTQLSSVNSYIRTSKAVYNSDTESEISMKMMDDEFI